MEKGGSGGSNSKEGVWGGLFFISVLLQQGGQLGDVRGDPPRLSRVVQSAPVLERLASLHI